MQQVYTFMRQEKLKRCSKGRELNPVPHGTTVEYSQLVIKNQQTSPGWSRTRTPMYLNLSEFVVSCRRLTFQISKNLHHVLAASHDRSSEDLS